MSTGVQQREEELENIALTQCFPDLPDRFPDLLKNPTSRFLLKKIFLKKKLGNQNFLILEESLVLKELKKMRLNGYGFDMKQMKWLVNRFISNHFQALNRFKGGGDFITIVLLEKEQNPSVLRQESLKWFEKENLFLIPQAQKMDLLNFLKFNHGPSMQILHPSSLAGSISKNNLADCYSNIPFMDGIEYKDVVDKSKKFLDSCEVENSIMAGAHFRDLLLTVRNFDKMKEFIGEIVHKVKAENEENVCILRDLGRDGQDLKEQGKRFVWG